MKKNLAIVLILIFICSTASCSLNQTQTSSPSVTTIPQTSETETVMSCLHTPITYSKIETLVERSNIILIGQVNAASIKRLYKSETGYVESGGEIGRNISSFFIHVDKVIKGSVDDADTIKIDTQRGGEVNGFLEIYEPYLPIPEIGKTYLFFIRTDEATKGSSYFEYMFTAAFDGFYLLENGLAIPQDQAACLDEQPIDELENKIRQIMLEN